MTRGEASTGNPNFLLVHHGRLSINVPFGIFRGRSTRFREPQASEFFETLRARYPWLTLGAITEIKREARAAMRSLIELEEGELDRARRLLEEGRPILAMEAIEAYLMSNPSDPDALQLKGRIQFALGMKDEGYRSFAEAQKADTSRRRASKAR